MNPKTKSEGVDLEVENLPNNRIIDNQYGKLVNQKANYLLGQPFVLEGENKQYIEFQGILYRITA